MALIVVLLAAIAGLQQNQSRSAGQSIGAEKARANALLAMDEAVGKLQRYAGPDTRTTASAAIFDTDPESPEINNVSNPHFIGVWRTDGLKDAPPYEGIIQNDGGGLVDVRVSGNVSAKDQVLEWLVSGSRDAQGDLRDPTQSLPGGPDAFRIARDPEVVDGTNDVRVPLVQISKGTNVEGAYGYWVADEGLKAKINLPNPNRSETPAWLDPDNGGFSRLYAPASNYLDDVWVGHEAMSEEDTGKLFTRDSVDVGLSTKTGSRDFHDYTTHSFSLLTNLRDGGLQQDLFGYLQGNGTEPALGPNRQGIADNQSILQRVEDREITGPKFGALRSWWKLSDEVSGEFGSREIDVQLPNMAVADRGNQTLTSQYNQPSLTNFDTQQITPVMTEAVMYMRHAVDSQRRPVQLMYPRVVLWNPYNVKLKAAGYFVSFWQMENVRVEFRYQDPNTSGFVTETAAINYNFTYNRERRPNFYLEPIELEPGEAVVFTTKPQGGMINGKAVPLAVGGDVRANVLSAEEDPNERYCFLLEMHFKGQWGGKFPTGTNLGTISYRYPQNIWWEGSKETQAVYFYHNGSSGSVPWNMLGTEDVPKIGALHFDNFSRGNNGRWGPTYRPNPQYTKLGEALLALPDTIIHWGGRLRWMREDFSNRTFGSINREPWYGAPIAFGNVRSPSHHRWLRDNMFGQLYTGSNTGTGGPRAHLYSFGLLSQTRQLPAWNSSETAPNLGPGGKYKTGVFQSASSADFKSTFPLFEVPDKDLGIFSLASLKHAQISPYWFHPTYPIGNSLAPPMVSLDRTALAAGVEESEKIKEYPNFL